ncbi:hypothetical protein TM49_20015 [Martelella endophytica]|uniref:Uncharacterized protein n=1 Tax=Martelella endophytica TaxID=1486262 RepID=A0A0D5LVP5_MAREN|nr:hypothetical protein TM49_20015 [Martelella endophytica]
MSGLSLKLMIDLLRDERGEGEDIWRLASCRNDTAIEGKIATLVFSWLLLWKIYTISCIKARQG